MKETIIVVLMILLSSPAFCWTLQWDDPGREDGIIVYYKPYPAGHSYPNNLAPAEKIINTDDATKITLPANTVKWKIPDTFEIGKRYVFVVRATVAGSVSGFSDFLCWTYPVQAKIIELPPAEGSIQINIYQTLR